MAIDDKDVIDFIGIDKQTQNISLAISDHLDWKDKDRHLETLQEKINRYLDFIESGDIYQHKKETVGKKIIIEVMGKYMLPPEALEFYKEVNCILADLKIELRFIPSVQ